MVKAAKTNFELPVPLGDRVIEFLNIFCKATLLKPCKSILSFLISHFWAWHQIDEKVLGALLPNYLNNFRQSTKQTTMQQFVTATTSQISVVEDPSPYQGWTSLKLLQVFWTSATTQLYSPFVSFSSFSLCSFSYGPEEEISYWTQRLVRALIVRLWECLQKVGTHKGDDHI